MYVSICEYCGTRYTFWPKDGRCLACGAPGIVAIKPEVAKLETPKPTLKNTVYKKIGFNKVAALAWGLFGILAISVTVGAIFPQYGRTNWNLNIFGSFLVMGLNAYLGQTGASIATVILLVLAFLQG